MEKPKNDAPKQFKTNMFVEKRSWLGPMLQILPNMSHLGSRNNFDGISMFFVWFCMEKPKKDAPKQFKTDIFIEKGGWLGPKF